ncbi:MAG: hypothetical protein GTO03_17255, partial [Planctomycetales bacterium]|nr:hypothetical protein [Planctomycetales bacterium]
MTRLSPSAARLLLVAAVVTAGAASTSAEVRNDGKERQIANWEEANQEVSQLHAELDSLRTQVEGAVPGEIPGEMTWDSGCADCGACEGCYCQLGCRWYAGAEVVVVKPHFEDGVTKIDGFRLDPDYDMEASPRVWLGYHNHAGLGVRARYWNWDHNSAGNDFEDQLEGDVPFGLQVQTLDLDVTQLVNWGPVETNLVGGLRYSYVEHREADGEGHQFEGWGPTFAFESLVPINCTNWAFVLNARGAMAFGETKFVEELGEFYSKDQDDLLWTLESQLGLQYATIFCNGSTLAFRAV